MKFCTLAAFLILSMPTAVTAATIMHTVSGKLDAVEYDFGGPASTVFLAETPIGSAYQLSFAYDTNSATLFSRPSGAWYPGIVSGNFAIDGVDFALAPADVTVGDDGPFVGTRFSLFGNFAPSLIRLNGFYAVDLSLMLVDSTSTVLVGPSLPTSLNLGDFDGSRMRLRFAGPAGETGILFTVDTLTSNSATAVPEPSTWAFMLIGFGLCGATLRRVRKTFNTDSARLSCLPG